MKSTDRYISQEKKIFQFFVPNFLFEKKQIATVGKGILFYRKKCQYLCLNLLVPKPENNFLETHSVSRHIRNLRCGFFFIERLSEAMTDFVRYAIQM